MRPDIRVRAGPNDFERPHIHEANIMIGSAQIIPGAVVAAIADNTVTPAKLRYDAYFQVGYDFGVIGLTEFSIDTWTTKSYDGGTV